ncbi:MAG: hypothetical protein RLZZ401_1342, partial [Pseudomonadota bacterium]
WSMLCLLLFLHNSAWADVWGYLDERGVPHFAAEKLDERYELFFRGNGMPVEDSPEALAMPRAVAVPTAPPKLVAFFEVSPSYKQVKHHMRAASNAYNIDFELLQAVIAAESGYDPAAVSPKGAVGLMQLMPATAQRFGVSGDARISIEKKLVDPQTNIHAGTQYLRYLLTLFAGRLELALAAYNAGEGAVQRAGNQIPKYKETQDYVKTVTNLYTWLKPPSLITDPRRATNMANQAAQGGRVRMELSGPPKISGGAAGRGNMVAPLYPGALPTQTISAP